MTATNGQVLERKSQVVRGASLVAQMLREEMDRRGLTAKELAMQLHVWASRDPANRWPLDYRTIQNAAGGVACALDTYLALAGFFGWDFVERVQTPVHGADRLTALEIEIEQERAEINAREVRLARLRSASSARRAVAAGGLRLVPEEGRAWDAQGWKRSGGMGEGADQ